MSEQNVQSAGDKNHDVADIQQDATTPTQALPVAAILESSGWASHSPTMRRMSVMLDPIPAVGELDMPAVQVSLVRPDGSVTTPRPEPQFEQISLSQDTEPAHPPAPSDYFSPEAMLAYSVSGLPTSDEPNQEINSTRRSSRSTDVESVLVEDTPLSRSSTRQTLASNLDDTDKFSASAGGDSSDMLWNYAQHHRQRPRTHRRSMTEYPADYGSDGPHYPDQSLAALHRQVYPPIYQAPYASRPPRSRRLSRPGPLFDSSARMQAETDPNADNLPRTVGNTPIMSPNTLFQPHRPLLTGTNSSDSSAVPSPYLHPVQGHPPKETSRATKDVDLNTGRKRINQYEMLYELGRGVHGKVKLARNIDTSEFVAIKIVQRYSKRKRLGKADHTEEKVKKEVAILKKAIHPNVVALIEVIDDPEIAKIYIVLEFCDGHEVHWRVPGASEIVLMENRRLEREMQGDADYLNDAQRAHFIRLAEKRRRNAARLDKPPLSRIQSASDFWSLEYAGSDDEAEEQIVETLETIQPLSRVTTNHTQGVAEQATVKDDLALEGHTQTDLALESNVDDPANPDDNHAHLSHTPLNGLFPGYNFGSHDKEQLMHSLTRMEETNKITEHRGRQRSIAESVSSHLTELVEEELDEELRYVPTMTLDGSRSAFRDAVLGLEYLHYQGIVHRDIKPANLLQKSYEPIKISDFGVSYLGKPIREGHESGENSESESQQHEEETELAKTVGTPAFYAPELCSLDLSSSQPAVTYQIDVWALGVTLYCLLYARTPFTADNEFALMRRIAEDDVFISRKRLKAVEIKSRSSSRGGMLWEPKNFRRPGELVYEDIDDELHDLLKRLFIKDPTERITIREIKRHPWVLRGIANPRKWIEDTDPARYQSGKKIEISNEEVAEAVIPLKLVERAKSLAKKAAGALGFLPRKRGQSSPTGSEAGSVASTSHHSDSSLKGSRKSSPKFDESLVAALKASRERDHHHHHHPLSQSVTASPDSAPADFSRDMDSISQVSSSEQLSMSSSFLSRPHMPSRHDPITSTAASIKTIRQVDVDRARHLNAGLAAEPTTPSMTTIFGGESRRSVLSAARSRDHADSGETSTFYLSSSRQDSPDPLHGKPSLGINTVPVEGQVNLPPALRDSPPQSEFLDLTPSVTPMALRTKGTNSGPASLDVTRSSSPVMGIDSASHMHRSRPGTVSSRMPSYGQVGQSNEDDEAGHYGLEEHSTKGLFRPISAPGMPTSPDAMTRPVLSHRESSQQSLFLELTPARVSTNSSALPSQAVSSVSSEDQISSVSHSTSLPSFDSIEAHDSTKDDNKSTSTTSSGKTAHDATNAAAPPLLDEYAFAPAYGHPYEDQRYSQASDEDSDSDEDFLVMSRPQSRVHRRKASNRADPLPQSSPLSKVERNESSSNADHT